MVSDAHILGVRRNGPPLFQPRFSNFIDMSATPQPAPVDAQKNLNIRSPM